MSTKKIMSYDDARHIARKMIEAVNLKIRQLPPGVTPDVTWFQMEHEPPREFTKFILKRLRSAGFDVKFGFHPETKVVYWALTLNGMHPASKNYKERSKRTLQEQLEFITNAMPGYGGDG